VSFSEQEAQQLIENVRRGRADQGSVANLPLVVAPKPRMNRTETRYANLLELRKGAGEIRDYRFESIKLRLADRTWYTPDFFVIRMEPCEQDTYEIHEVKGFWRDDARVKIKVAAEMFKEFTFYVCQYKKGQWIIREV